MIYFKPSCTQCGSPMTRPIDRDAFFCDRAGCDEVVTGHEYHSVTNGLLSYISTMFNADLNAYRVKGRVVEEKCLAKP